jgi:hypothetical protein
MSEQLSQQGYAPVPEFYTGAWANVRILPRSRAKFESDAIFRSTKAFMALTETS